MSIVEKINVTQHPIPVLCQDIALVNGGQVTFTIPAGQAFVDRDRYVRSFFLNGRSYLLTPYVKKTSMDSIGELIEFLTSIRSAAYFGDISRIKDLPSSTAFWAANLLAGFALKQLASKAIVRISDELTPIADPVSEIFSKMASEKIINGFASNFFTIDQIEYAYIDVLSKDFTYYSYLRLQ